MPDLELLADDYAVCRLPADGTAAAGIEELAALVELAARGCVVSVTWTPDEVSVMCPSAVAPSGATVETPWRCFRVSGPANLALTGILASIVSPLADARVNIFAFSTYDTDYLLVPSVRLSEAVFALSGAGHRISGLS